MCSFRKRKIVKQKQIIGQKVTLINTKQVLKNGIKKTNSTMILHDNTIVTVCFRHIQSYENQGSIYPNI